jgi:hypothetical protein
MNVNINRNMYWVFRPFTWLSLGVGAVVVVGYIVWLFAMLKYAV